MSVKSGKIQKACENAAFLFNEFHNFLGCTQVLKMDKRFKYLYFNRDKRCPNRNLQKAWIINDRPYTIIRYAGLKEEIRGLGNGSIVYHFL